jgi:hypothetical protein
MHAGVAVVNGPEGVHVVSVVGVMNEKAVEGGQKDTPTRSRDERKISIKVGTGTTTKHSNATSADGERRGKRRRHEVHT